MTRAPRRAAVLHTAAALAALAACGGEPAPGRPADRPAGADRQLAAPAADRDGITRVLVFYDMEGAAGQDDWRTFLYGMPQYPRGRELLTADLNAVIAGLFDGGADSVDVVDAHGSTNAAEPDALADRLDPRARIVFRDRPFSPMVDLVEPGRYDALVGVAHHARTGSGGFASHTITIGMAVELNGRAITEVELMAYAHGAHGVPLIFVAGDDRLARDLRELPWIQYVVTKDARSADSVTLRNVDSVHAEMRAKARRAVERRGEAKALRLATPVTTTLRAVQPASLRLLRDVPGIDYHDEAVTFQAPDLRTAYNGLERLINLAQSGYQNVMLEAWMAGPGGETMMQRGLAAVIGRWMDVESGRWSGPPPGAPLDRAGAGADTGRRYHGAN